MKPKSTIIIDQSTSEILMSKEKLHKLLGFYDTEETPEIIEIPKNIPQLTERNKKKPLTPTSPSSPLRSCQNNPLELNNKTKWLLMPKTIKIPTKTMKLSEALADEGLYIVFKKFSIKEL
jgi:hypothetical protein